MRSRLTTALVAGVVCFLAGMPAASAGLSISAPANANLGSAATGSSTLSAQLGTVEITYSGLLLLATTFTSTVSATDFTTAGGGANKTISKSSISYWSGPATAVSGVNLGAAVPGQLTSLNAVSLSAPRTAFSVASLLGLLTISVDWNPTVVVNIPASAIAGTYTGTITHSVA